MSGAMIYELTDQDRAIIDASWDDINLFTNYYLRSSNGSSGTWFRADDDRPLFQTGWVTLDHYWKSCGKPEYMGFTADKVMEAISEPIYIKRRDELAPVEKVYRIVIDNYGNPSFFIHHGFMFQAWQKEGVTSYSDIIMFMGGYAAGKTEALIAWFLWSLAVKPGFIGFAVAPYFRQALEVFNKARQMLQGTIYEERFIPEKDGYRQKPPLIRVKHSGIGELNTFEMFPALDDPDKVLNLEGDAAMVDQAEKFPEILDEDGGLLPALSSRLRGYHKASGRERDAKIFWVANPNDNEEIWLLAEKVKQQGHYKQVSTYDNPYLSARQIKNFERQFGETEEAARVNLMGFRPKGAGKTFSRQAIDSCYSLELDQMHMDGIETRLAGYEKVTKTGIGTHKWCVPYVRGRKYMAFADPGQGNPPKRNAPCVMVWDVTDFPQEPAVLVYFHWVFAQGDMKAWAKDFMEAFDLYNCQGGGWDGTGKERGYEVIIPKLRMYDVVPVDFAGGKKDRFITFLKGLMSHGKLQWGKINPVDRQLARYTDPDTGIPQDIVMTMVVMAAILGPQYKSLLDEEDEGYDAPQKVVRDSRYSGRKVGRRNVRTRRGRR